MLEQPRHLANKYEDIVNLQGWGILWRHSLYFILLVKYTSLGQTTCIVSSLLLLYCHYGRYIASAKEVVFLAVYLFVSRIIQKLLN